MAKYQELESKIAELQSEVERLKKEEKDNQLPKDFDREYAILFQNGVTEDGTDSIDLARYLDKSFTWYSTPQGNEYWEKVYTNLKDCVDGYQIPQEAIIQIQKWVILSYQQEYES